MSGILLSRFAIISAFSLMSFREAKPRSGCPNLEAQVPAPVYNPRVNKSNFVREIAATYHVKTIKTNLKGHPCTEAVIDAGCNNDISTVCEHTSESSCS